MICMCIDGRCVVTGESKLFSVCVLTMGVLLSYVLYAY